MNAGLSQAEQNELQRRMEARQMKDFMNVYSNMVQKCFDDCINDFTSKSLTGREERCTLQCVDKLLKGQERLGQRFQELNASMMQTGAMPGK